ncbi:hypothetical protein GC207_13080 [bacterium]|nr:hypothetical protein [bacterium]
MIEAVGKMNTTEPAHYVLLVTRFLDRLIEEQGHYLFMGFAFCCFVVIAWIFMRPRRRRSHRVSHSTVVVLPLVRPPEREPEWDWTRGEL